MIVLFVVCLPTLLGSQWLYRPLLKSLASDDFDLEVDSVKLRWLQPLELNGIRISNSATAPPLEQKVAPELSLASRSGKPLLAIQQVRSNRGLLAYLWNGRNLGRIEIVHPTIDIELLENSSNLDRLIKSVRRSGDGGTASKKSTPLAIDLEVAVRGLSVIVENGADGQPLVVVPSVDSDLRYSATGDRPRLSIQPMKVLDHVVITPQLIGLGLGHAVPLLAKSAWFDGSVSLATDAIEIPLDRPIGSTGNAKLTLHQVRSGPSEPAIVAVLDLIARLRGREPNYELVFVDGSEIGIQVDNARVAHTGMRAGLPRIDPRLQIQTEGSVGLEDRSIDLMLEVPVPVEQLAQRESVKQLGVPLLRLPINGTLDHPTVNWRMMRGDSADLLSMIARQLEGEAPGTSAAIEALSGIAEGKGDHAIGAAVDWLRELRNRRRQQDSGQPDEVLPDDEHDPATDKPKGEETGKRHPLRDALRGLLRGDKP